MDLHSGQHKTLENLDQVTSRSYMPSLCNLPLMQFHGVQCLGAPTGLLVTFLLHVGLVSLLCLGLGVMFDTYDNTAGWMRHPAVKVTFVTSSSYLFELLKIVNLRCVMPKCAATHLS